MFLRDLLFSCLRRWYLLLTGVALTVLGGYLTLSVVLPTYQAEASVVLLPPDAVITTGDNPYLYLGGLDQALGILQVKMNSPEVMEPIIEPYAGSRAEYVVGKDLSTTGPIILITTSGESSIAVMALLQDTIDALPPNLLALQEQLNVSSQSRITTMVLAQDEQAEISHKKQLRSLVVVVGGGLVLSVLAVGWLDRLLLIRRNRRGEADIGPAAAAHAGAGEDDAAQPTASSPDTAEDVASEKSGASAGSDDHHDFPSTDDKKLADAAARTGT